MSTHKTTADQEIIVSFLKDNFSDNISNFEVITGGEGSQAYSFDVEEKQYILRINRHDPLGFKRDEYASNHYSSPLVPIPKVYKLGKIDNDLHFCISQKVQGKILALFSNKELEILRPAMFEVLKAIHATDISNTKGYGKWDDKGQGEYASWKEFLLSVDLYTKGVSGAPSLFETTFLEKNFWDKAYSRFIELVPFCPEERFLVHGDYGSDNILSDGEKITGVIDWGGSKYGDFIYDVAWLSFWSHNLDYQESYLEYSKKKMTPLKNFNERLLCYKIFIGLRSMSFFAYSGQKDKYVKTKEAVASLLNQTN